MKRYLSVLFFIWFTLHLAAQVEVKAQVDSAQILVGGQTWMSVSVLADKDSKVTFPTIQNHQLTKSIEVIKEQNNKSEASDGKVNFQHRYLITAWDAGKCEIPSMKVKVNGKDYETHSIPLEVLTVAVDTLHPNNLKPQADVEEPTLSWDDWSTSFWLFVLVVMLVALDVYLYKRLRKTPSTRVVPVITKMVYPHQQALEQIQELKASFEHADITQKDYYTHLTEILRSYLAVRFGIQAKEQTSAEIIACLAQSKNNIGQEQLRELLLTADLVKFAKFSTPRNEDELYLDRLTTFITQSKEGETPIVVNPVEDNPNRLNRQKQLRRLLKVALGVIALIAASILVYIAFQVYGLLV